MVAVPPGGRSAKSLAGVGQQHGQDQNQVLALVPHHVPETLTVPVGALPGDSRTDPGGRARVADGGQTVARHGSEVHRYAERLVEYTPPLLEHRVNAPVEAERADDAAAVEASLPVRGIGHARGRTVAHTDELPGRQAGVVGQPADPALPAPVCRERVLRILPERGRKMQEHIAVHRVKDLPVPQVPVRAASSNPVPVAIQHTTNGDHANIYPLV